MNDLIERLRKRAEIRRQIPGRKSVQEGKSDRIADVLDEAANRIEELEQRLEIDPRHGVDGIEARDETIKLLERVLDEQIKENTV